MAEFVIVGGGVYGTATAWHLARAGAEVTVLERKAVASGASGGPGRRGVRANGRDHRELPLMRAAFPLWEGLDEVLGCDGLFERTGNLRLTRRAQDLPAARAQAAMQNRAGIETHVLDARQVRELEPHVEADTLGAIFCPGDGAADHTRTTRAYAAAAGRAGARIREGVEAVEVIDDGARATGVRTADREVVEAASGVILLSNWSVGDLLDPWAAFPVWSEAFQALLSRPLADMPVRHVVGHASRTLSLKPEAGNRLMISGGHRGHYDLESHVGTALSAAIAANVAEAVATYPALAGIEIETADAGHLESVSLDQIPVIDQAPGCESLWFATGWCGHGWAIAPVVADLLARFVVEGNRPGLLAPFALSRFD